MVKKRGLKKSIKIPQPYSKLSDTQKEILYLISEDFLTIEQIANRRGTSQTAVYKIVKKLKNKGFLAMNFRGVKKIQPSTLTPSDKRLHSQEWNIKILWQNHYYQNKYKKSNTRFIDGHTIRLYRNSIEVYAGEGTSFFGETEQRATAKSLVYWERFFHKLEHEFKIILIKPRCENINLVSHHYGNIFCDFSKDCSKNKQRIRIYAREDGKLWFDMDNSFKFKEREHPHPETAKQDSELVSKHIDDWRNNNPPTNSELAIHVQELIQDRKFWAKHQRSHVAAIKELSKGVRKLNKLVGNVLNENKRLKSKNRSLGEFI